jgi:predicted dehydrogenase
MGAVLDLIADGRLNVEALVSAVTPIDRAAEGFGLLVAGRPDVVGVVLDYGEPTDDRARKFIRRVDHAVTRKMPLVKPLARPVRLALIGAGSFGQTVYLPLIDAHPQAALQAVVTARGHNAMRLAKLYNARTATTNLSSVLGDESVDAVIIATRHHQHADMAIEALKAGKHVLLEKPLAITLDQMERLEAAIQKSDALLTVGHNRRYAPGVQALVKSLSGRVGPLMAVYRINAGYIPPDHWVHARDIGGGRVIGEVCHFVDLLGMLTGSEVADLSVQGVPSTARAAQNADNLSAALRYTDGSVATLVYTSLGAGELPKERLELFWDGRAAVLDDFRTLTSYGTESFGEADKQDKGWEEQFARFIEAVRGGNNRLLTAAEAINTARLTFRIDELLVAQQKGKR